MSTNSGGSDDLDLLREFDVPTLANAVELFGVMPANQGFCNSKMTNRFPDRPLMLGYAVTSRASTTMPLAGEWKGIDEEAYWDFIAAQKGPKIAVCKDIDDPPSGAMWGEFNANVHKALGCIGIVADGAVRDLPGVEKLDIDYFSTSIHPSHGYAAFIDFGCPLYVAGMEIHTGDLLAGDSHGIIRIPLSIPLDKLAETARDIESLEREIFSLCQSRDFSLAELKELNRSVNRRWPDPWGKNKPTKRIVK